MSQISEKRIKTMSREGMVPLELFCPRIELKLPKTGIQIMKT